MNISVDLSGKRALVTGAGSGIGRGCAETLAAAGASVIIADMQEEAAREVASAIEKDGGKATALRLDVTDWDDARRAAEAQEQAGGLHILVNCAATWKIGPFIETDNAEIMSGLGVTLVGTLVPSRALLPVIIASGGGTIVNISSDAGRIGERSQVVYSAAKAGVIGFTKALAKEVGRNGVRVNCIAPGLTRTPSSEAFLEQMRVEDIRRAYPLGRVGEPGDIANAVLYMASELSGWVTGQILSVSGGYSTAG
ncbi:MAG: SDR family oxidoreductase [Nitratireductor sp.]|nr:SDR family oxidoreductase [Nitratireductor sp.]